MRGDVKWNDPISSRGTAIPEFIDDGVNGFATRSAGEITQRILELYSQPQLFETMSESAAKSIRMKAGLTTTVEQELDLLLKQFALVRIRRKDRDSTYFSCSPWSEGPTFHVE